MVIKQIVTFKSEILSSNRKVDLHLQKIKKEEREIIGKILDHDMDTDYEPLR